MMRSLIQKNFSRTRNGKRAVLSGVATEKTMKEAGEFMVIKKK